MFGFGFFRKDREVLAQHTAQERRQQEQRVEDLYEVMSQAIALGLRVQKRWEQAVAQGDEPAAYAAQHTYNRLVMVATVTQRTADALECELIWDLPAAPRED